MHGNMSGVYRAFAEMEQIAGRAETLIMERTRAGSRLEAEAHEGATADWYLIETFAGDDLRAMRWLARRRFGVFRPMQQRRVARNEGQQVGVKEAAFPGWLFVFVFGMGDAMRRRLRAVPGVKGILCDPVTLQPVAIPDSFVQDIRALAWIYDDRLAHVARNASRHVSRMKPVRPARLQKNVRRSIERLRKDLKRSGRFDRSTWDKASELAPDQRIALLRQALRGPAVAGCASI